jgi:uncharacterized protein
MAQRRPLVSCHHATMTEWRTGLAPFGQFLELRCHSLTHVISSPFPRLDLVHAWHRKSSLTKGRADNRIASAWERTTTDQDPESPGTFMMTKPLIETSNGFKRRRICMLMITHQCNLRCAYCYELFKSDRHMDVGLAKSILLKELEFVRKSDQYDELEIDFMGGEPFIDFELIKEIVEWLLRLKNDVPFVCFCSTNGTLISGEIREWLSEHRDVFVPGLSYDGSLDMQRQNRGVHAQDIDIQFFLDLWPSERVHMTISKETLPDLAKGALALHEAGAVLEAALAQGVEWTRDDAAVYGEQLDVLSKAYIANIDFVPINLLSRPLFGIASPRPFQEKFCGTGTSMITYDVDGGTYPCHMFSPIVLGDGALELKDSPFSDGCNITDQFCLRCILSNWCPTCYGYNHRLRGDVSLRDHRWCSMVFTQARASCEFQISCYHRSIGSLTQHDMAQLKGAIEAHHLLATDDRARVEAGLEVNHAGR